MSVTILYGLLCDDNSFNMLVADISVTNTNVARFVLIFRYFHFLLCFVAPRIHHSQYQAFHICCMFNKLFISNSSSVNKSIAWNWVFYSLGSLCRSIENGWTCKHFRSSYPWSQSQNHCSWKADFIFKLYWFLIISMIWDYP